VLSTGEQFRCDLARALLVGCRSPGGNAPDTAVGCLPVVFDEYTSVVDRNVAQIASAALAKGIKSGKIPCRFVAVTCHYDILDWLEPDWVLDTATGTVQRYCAEGRLLRRPNIDLEIFRCERSLWSMFKPHHYLSGNLANACRCYVAVMKQVVHRPPGDGSAQPTALPDDVIHAQSAFADDTARRSVSYLPVAFCALLPQQGFERWYRVSRIVTLPDYQGVGIGARFLDTLADMYRGQGFRFSITASHPSVLSHCKRSEHWKAINVQKTGSKHSLGRAVVSFEWR
jgi:GNAT superfamily N-acetyltransferase